MGRRSRRVGLEGRWRDSRLGSRLGRCVSAARGRRSCHAGSRCQRGERQRAASARANGPKRGASTGLRAEGVAGPAWGENGTLDLGWEKGKWASGLGCQLGLGWFLVLFFFLSIFLSLILIQTQAKRIQINLNTNSIQTTKEKMLQHECNNKV